MQSFQSTPPCDANALEQHTTSFSKEPPHHRSCDHYCCHRSRHYLPSSNQQHQMCQKSTTHSAPNAHLNPSDKATYDSEKSAEGSDCSNNKLSYITCKHIKSNYEVDMRNFNADCKHCTNKHLKVYTTKQPPRDIWRQFMLSPALCR